MSNIIDTLKQEEFWYAQDGMPVAIKQMDESYINNVLAFLRRRAESLYDHLAWQELRLMQDAPDGVFDDWMADLRRELEESPEVWLNRQPLILALEKELRDRNTIDGEVVAEPTGSLSSDHRSITGNRMRLG